MIKREDALKAGLQWRPFHVNIHVYLIGDVKAQNRRIDIDCTSKGVALNILFGCIFHMEETKTREGRKTHRDMEKKKKYPVRVLWLVGK